MVPHHMRKSFEIKKYIFIFDFRMVPRNEYSRAMMIQMHSAFSEHKVGILSFRMACRTLT